MARGDKNKSAPKGKKRGPKSSYDPVRMPEQAYHATSRMGAEHLDLAALFGVSLGPIEKWIREHDEFRVAIRTGRDEWSSRNIEDSLKRRALGYEYQEHKTSAKNGPETITKHMPPDVGACIFWLTNRQKNRWQQMRHVINSGKTEQEFSLNVNQKIDIKNLDRSQLEQLRDIIAIAKNVKLPADIGSEDAGSSTGSTDGGNGIGNTISKTVH